MDLFWTPGWDKLLTLTVAPTATLLAVWLGQSFQTRRFEAESKERDTDKLREALADLLALHWTLGRALGDVHVAKLDAYQRIRKSDDDFAITEKHRDARENLIEATTPMFIAITRIELLTRDQQVLKAVRTLDDNFEVALKESGVVPMALASLKDWQRACDAVHQAFQAARNVAANSCAAD